jgi:hypothetical protein
MVKVNEQFTCHYLPSPVPHMGFYNTFIITKPWQSML